MGRAFRVSLAVRRAGIAALAVMLVLWLGAITYWRFEQLGAAPRATLLAAVWGLGIVALALLARGWRSR